MTPQTGELYALGVNAYLDDNYIHLHGRRTINEVNRLWREWFDGSVRRRRDHRTGDGAAPAPVDHGPAVAHPASR